MPAPHDEPSRLADALDAFLQRGTAGDESDSAYLARHAEVRDLLEPMLAGVRDDEPRTIGPYRIVREVGRGGMGVVYEAEHTALHRAVALKVLPTLFAIAPRRVERFLREAAAVARLDHRGIVRVFDAGEADGVFYYAMELVDGRSLRAALDAVRARCQDDARRLTDAPQLQGDAPPVPSTRTRVDEIAELGAEIADALAHAHAQGIVHRDVKPQNILLTQEGNARLVDFGLVKDLDASGPSLEFAGTPHYASPEQIDPSRAALDGRADVFSLGVVLYELATLRRPFEGTSAESVLRAVCGDEPRGLRSFDPRIARDFEAVVLQALEKSPGARYPTAAALAADLRRCLHREPVRARRLSAWRYATRWLARHRLAAAAAVMAALLLIGGPSVALWFSARARDAVDRERVAADARFAAARHSLEQLALRLTDRDLPDAPLLQRFRLGLLQDVRRGYEALLDLAGGAVDVALLRDAARSCAHAGEALRELGDVVGADAVFTRGIELAERALRCAPGDADHIVMLAEAHTGRGLSRFATHGNGYERADFTAARNLWCDLDTHRDAQGARTVAGRVVTELRFADVQRNMDPEAAQDALARAQNSPLWRSPRESELDIAGEIGLLAAELAILAGDLPRARAARERGASWLQQAHARAPRSFRVRSLLARQHLVDSSLATNPAAAQVATRAAIAAHEVLAREYPDVVAARHGLATAKLRLVDLLLRDSAFAEAAPIGEAALLLAADLAAEAPGRTSLWLLARGIMIEGILGSRTGAPPTEVDAAFAEAARMMEYLVAAAPRDLIMQSQLGAIASNHAQVLLIRRDDPAQAAALLRRAVAAQRRALAGAPSWRTYCTFLESHLALLAQACFRANDLAGGRDALDELAALLRDDSEQLVTVAAGYLYCATRDQSDAVEAALRALQRLADGVARKSLATLPADRRFALLHADPRFVELVERTRRPR